MLWTLLSLLNYAWIHKVWKYNHTVSRNLIKFLFHFYFRAKLEYVDSRFWDRWTASIQESCGDRSSQTAPCTDPQSAEEVLNFCGCRKQLWTVIEHELSRQWLMFLCCYMWTLFLHHKMCDKKTTSCLCTSQCLCFWFPCYGQWPSIRYWKVIIIIIGSRALDGPWPPLFFFRFHHFFLWG